MCILSFLLALGLPFVSLATGDISLRLGWRSGAGIEAQASLALDWSQGPLYLSASLGTSYPSWDWGLLLEGRARDDISRLGLRVGFGSGGWEYTRLELGLFPRSEISVGKLTFRAGISSHFRRRNPGIGTSVVGSLSFRYRLEPFWCESRASFSLYPSRTIGPYVFSLGYRASPWHLSVRTGFDGGWEGITVGASYLDRGLESGLSLSLSPQGLQRGSLSLGLQMGSIKASARGEIGPAGFLGVSLSLSLSGDDWEASLGGRIGGELHLEELSLRVRYRF